MSEMGLMTNGLAKEAELLPSLFTRLKDDRFITGTSGSSMSISFK